MSMIGSFHTFILLFSATYASDLWCWGLLRCWLFLRALEVLFERIGDAASAPTSNSRSYSSSFLHKVFQAALLGFSIILMRGMLLTIMMILDAAGKATFSSVKSSYCLRLIGLMSGLQK
jgi:hypothetical protein